MMNARPKEVYTVLLTLSGLLEQPSSMTAAAVAVAAGAVLAVAEATEALRATRLEDALFARCASTPVAAARPITAAERKAMMHERMKTSRLQPSILLSPAPGLASGGLVVGCACPLKGDATVWPPYVDGGAGVSILGAAAAEGS